MDKIINELKQVFINASFYDKDTYSHRNDPSGKSKITDAFFKLESGDIVIGCFDYSKEHGSQDHLNVAIVSREIDDWFKDDPYN